MKTASTLLILLSCLTSHGQTIKHKIETGNTGVACPASTDLMTKRIKESAVMYEEHAPVPRIVQLDYAFGADSNEFKALNTFGILYIASLNQDKTEYPIKRVYLKADGREIELIKLGSTNVSVTDAMIKKVFGENRIDYYYLIPFFYTQLTGELVIDWSANREGFVLCQLPKSVILDYSVTDANMYPYGKESFNEKALSEFMEREFQIKMSEK